MPNKGKMNQRNEVTEWATLGTIVAPFGLRGELKVLSLTDIPNRFATLEAVYLTPDYRRRTIKAVRPYKGEMLLLTLEGIDTITIAETLRNCDLCIPSTELAELPPDAYYQHDILGLQVLRLDGQRVGVISDIMNTSGNDIYIVKADDGQQFLIPAVTEVVKQIDLIRRVMSIDPMPGLLDNDAEIVLQTEE